MAVHPEIRWAQRSSETEAEKVCYLSCGINAAPSTMVYANLCRFTLRVLEHRVREREPPGNQGIVDEARFVREGDLVFC